MPETISDLARRLAESAEAVCRHYLPSGRRHGSYWVAGDVHDAPGRSLYVRLRGPRSGKGATGRWTDAATGEHGDLLDLIQAARGLHGIGEALDEARRFLGGRPTATKRPALPPSDPSEAVRRLWDAARPITGTTADAYLRQRGISLGITDATALRYHPRCFYRADPRDPADTPSAWPALLAAVTDLDGEMTGLQRIWLDPVHNSKAPVAIPRRALGHLLGHAVRLGSPCRNVGHDVMAAGEGIETTLSLRCALPCLPLAAALSAGNLAALLFPPALRRVYVARDDDPAGHWAVERLTARARAVGIEVLVLAPTRGDWNDDLLEFGPDVLATALRSQLAPEDVTRFWRLPRRGGREA